MIDLSEVLRAYVESLIGDRPASDFVARTGIPSSDTANILNRKGNRRVTADKLAKIARGYNLQWSRVFADLALLAARMEAVAMPAPVSGAKAPPDAETPSRPAR